MTTASIVKYAPNILTFTCRVVHAIDIYLLIRF
jgi:hypothetical protein